MVKYLGYGGIIYSSALCSFVVILAGFLFFKHYYNFNLRYTLRKLLLILLASLLAVLPSLLMMRFLPFNYDSRFICIFMMIPHGLVAMSIYLIVTLKLSLPQTIFHFEGKNIKTFIKKLR